jgi:hypothetical protein
MTPSRRKSDNSFAARIEDRAKHYGIFWLPLLWLFGSLGFSLITPRITISQMKAVFDSVTVHLQKEIDANRAEARDADTAILTVHITLTDQMEMLLRHACLDGTMTDRDIKEIGLPCDSLFIGKRLKR